MKHKSVIIFGIEKLSSLAWYCLSHDTDYSVIGFTVNKEYIDRTTHHDLNVIPFETIIEIFPPETVSFLLPIGFSRINGLRMERYQQLKEAGYEIIDYVSSRASVWPDLELHGNCMIYENTVIQPFSVIGENVIINNSVQLSHHCRIGSHCFIAAGVTFGGNVEVGERSFLGIGSVIRNDIKIAERTFVGAGAVVISDTEPDSVYIGNPAKKIDKFTSMDITGVLLNS